MGSRSAKSGAGERFPPLGLQGQGSLAKECCCFTDTGIMEGGERIPFGDHPLSLERCREY